MQTATATRRCGLKPVLFLYSLVGIQEDVCSNLLLDTVLGADIHMVPVGKSTVAQAKVRLEELSAAYMIRMEETGEKCYDIPVWGANEVGSAAFIYGFVVAMEKPDRPQQLRKLIKSRRKIRTWMDFI